MTRPRNHVARRILRKALRKRECECCHEWFPRKDVPSDSRMCESCEQEHDYCSVCREWFGQYSECRHLNWVDEVGMCGCGSYTDAEDHRDDFMALLSLLEPLEIVTRAWCDETEKYLEPTRQPLLPEMRRRIAANDFWTQWHGRYELHLCYGESSFNSIYAISNQQFTAWDDGLDGELRDESLGLAWLCSLDDKSLAANQLTVQWIDEYPQASVLLREQKRRQQLFSELMKLAGDDDGKLDDFKSRLGISTGSEFNALPLSKIEAVLSEVRS